MESACYLSIVRSPKVLIAGDHQQLPPTVMSTEAASKGLMKSLMERIIGKTVIQYSLLFVMRFSLDLYGDQVTRMLKVQYRMNSDIMDWASEALYEKQLSAHESVANHLLKDLPGVSSNEDTGNIY